MVQRRLPAASTCDKAVIQQYRRLRSRSKLTSVIGGPIEERVRRYAGDLCDCRCNKRSMAGRGRPCVERHIEQSCGPSVEPLTPPLSGLDLCEAERAANRPTNDGYLLGVSQGVRSGQNILA